MMRKLVSLWVVLTGFVMAPLSLQADIWTGEELASRAGTPQSARFRLNEKSLLERLSQAPHEVFLDRSVTLEVPMPDGTTQRFSIVESPIVPAGFAQRFPGMKTFKLHGVDDRAASGRADITSKGFRAMLQTSQGVVFIDPEAITDRLYKSYFRRGTSSQPFICGVHGRNENPLAHVNGIVKPSNRLAGNFQTYRIAVAATQEYVDAVGGTESAARAEIMTAINRVNQVYETALGIRLLLVGNNGDLLEDDDDDCFSNDDITLMVSENQAWIDATIGSSAYDIGHVFSTYNGGLAGLGVACSNDFKARGATGLPNPTGDPFYIDFVAHEIGHQLNADHTFNGTTSACGGGNRNGATAFEPGSGSTIMAYTGICAAENLQDNSDATFHAGSIAKIGTFTLTGGSCHGTVANGNTDPTVTTALADLTIPSQTPFRLEVTAADADPGDTLVYQWDQMDSGQSTSSATFGTDLGNNTLFRSYAPQADAWRDFPALGTQLLGQTDKAEVLPDPRQLNFRVTVFDNNSGQATDDIMLTVSASTGFQVTSPNGGTLDTTTTPYTIEWDPAGTGGGTAVNCPSVDIDLLTFSNATYDEYSVHSIAAGVPNDGSEDVTLASSHPRARIRIKCSDNVFYDISDDDVTVVGTAGTFGDTAFTTFFNRDTGGNDNPTVSRSSSKAGDAALQTGDMVVGLFASADAASSARIEECLAGGASSGSQNGDASAADPRWLLLLGLLAGLAKLRRRYGLQ